MPVKIDICTGMRFGRLSIVKELDVVVYASGGRSRKFLCMCDCGRESVVSLCNLRNGTTRSCGCYLRDILSKRNRTHGMRHHTLYSVWTNMITRCCNTNAVNFRNYGGRGIGICVEWKKSFAHFSDWALSHGWKEGLQIDRINNNGHYEPQNCRFVTNSVNGRNRRNNRLLTFDGVTLCAADWADRIGVEQHIIECRLRRGWSIERTLTQKVRKWPSHA